MIQETSLEAFTELKPILNKREEQVLSALEKLEVANNKMISKYSGISLSCVCGRMDTLRNKKKLVTFSHKGICPYTNKSTNFFKVIKYRRLK